jgi:hypothetical protein
VFGGKAGTGYQLGDIFYNIVFHFCRNVIAKAQPEANRKQAGLLSASLSQ